MLILLGLELLSVHGWAQRPANWHMFRVGDELAESYSVAVTVSPTGNVWVKHRDANAISVLDGYTVHTQPSPGRDNYRVYENRTGQLWSLYSTNRPNGQLDAGLMVYVTQNGWIRRSVPEIVAEIKAYPGRQVMRQIPLVPAERDHVLFLVSDKLMEYNLAEKKATVVKQVSQTGLGKFNEMIESRQDGLWVTGAKGLARLAGPVRHLRAGAAWQEFLVGEALHAENLQRPFEDEQGGITVLANDSRAPGKRLILHFDGKNWSSRPIDVPRVNQAWPGWDGTTWAFTLDSLLRFDPPPSTNITHEKVWAGQYKDVAMESGDVFWLATSEGLFRYAPHLWRTPVALEDFGGHVHAMLQDPAGRIWFAASDQLLSLKDGNWTNQRWPEGWEGSFETGDSLYALPDGRLAVTAGERLLLFDPAAQQFRTVVQPSGQGFRVVGQLPNRKLVIQRVSPPGHMSSGFELEQFDGDQFEPFLRTPPDWSQGNDIYRLLSEPNGDLWLGGTAYVARYRNGQFEIFGPARGFRGAKALWMAEAGGGRLWCASSDRIFEFNGKSWSLLRAGFDRISRIVRGHDDKMWIATAAGLYSYANGSWVGYGPEEGLPSPGVSEVLADRHGQLWAGTTRGLSLYHPDADLLPPKTAPPVLDNANRQSTGEKVTVFLSGIDRWQQTPTDRLLYATRLDEGPWSAYTNSMVKTFERLGAGKHRLEVRAMDRNWNEDRDFAWVDFSVVVAWYKDPRLLVIMLSGAVLVLFFAGLAVNRHLQLIRSYAEVERIVALRTRELERANQELLQSQKMKALGTLAAGIAHDFNNILSIIRGSAQIIQSNLEDRQKVLTRISRIQAVVEQGSGIVKSILGLSRVQEKHRQLADLNSVVNDTIKLIEDRFLHEVTIEFRPIPNLPPVLLVKELLQQMLLNLILNAADAMEQRGQVLLRTGELPYLPVNLALSPARAPGYVAVSVQDNGCGIAPEILPRIFEPFFTTKALSARRGTGLGLSIVYELARGLGYGLEVKSAVGKGSTFTIILPAESQGGPRELTVSGKTA